MASARSATQETSLRAEELVGHCSAAHVAAQRAAEQGAHVAQQSATLDEELRALRPDLDTFTRSALQVGTLAQREFALGIEALERFVRQEPLRRVHECVFGVLALESEPVDPRL